MNCEIPYLVEKSLLKHGKFVTSFIFIFWYNKINRKRLFYFLHFYQFMFLQSANISTKHRHEHPSDVTRSTYYIDSVYTARFIGCVTVWAKAAIGFWYRPPGFTDLRSLFSPLLYYRLFSAICGYVGVHDFQPAYRRVDCACCDANALSVPLSSHSCSRRNSTHSASWFVVNSYSPYIVKNKSV